MKEEHRKEKRWLYLGLFESSGSSSVPVHDDIMP